MKKSLLVILLAVFTTTPFFAQEVEQVKQKQKAHYNISKFKRYTL